MIRISAVAVIDRPPERKFCRLLPYLLSIANQLSSEQL
jgi:hypothetical protein